MSRVVAVEYLSLDGVMEEPRWSAPYFNDEVADFQLNNLMGSDALLLGRVTYEGFKSSWPTMTDEAGFADKMNRMPKYVATSTLDSGEWNANLLKGDVVEEVTALKGDFAGTLLINGSAELFRALHAAGLIDEYRFMIYPVVVAHGKRLFADETGASADGRSASSRAGDLALVKSQITNSGVAILTYHRAPAMS
jgi:dihydrofolate reductase